MSQRDAQGMQAVPIDPHRGGDVGRPVLRFRGTDGDRLRLRVTGGAGRLPRGVAGDVSGDLPEPFALGSLAGRGFEALDLTLAMANGRALLPTGLTEALPDLPREIAVPEPGGPLRLAFTSCNGAEDMEEADAMPGGRNALWSRLAERHAEEPFHLLVLGGDQIYADGVWDLPSIAAWNAIPRPRRLKAPFTETMRAELEAHYLAVYEMVLGAPEVSGLLSRIPSIMMWDDHDIVDGWGSRAAGWQNAPVAQGLFQAARRAFALVQQGVAPDAEPDAAAGYAVGTGFGWSGDLGPARIVMPDLRSRRTRGRVLGRAGHQHLARDLSGHARPHTLLVSTVPLVNADLSAVERIVSPLLPSADLYQDDLRDQWMSFAHREEWHVVADRLLEASETSRVSVLSGEIHLGAHGVATRGARRIEQFIASGISHPPPPRALARGFEFFARRTRRRRDIAIDMQRVSPDGRSYVAERNWLEVTAGADGALSAVLHAEDAGPLKLAGPVS